MSTMISPEVVTDAAEPPEVVVLTAVFPEEMVPAAVSPEVVAHARTSRGSGTRFNPLCGGGTQQCTFSLSCRGRRDRY